jgi:hypothetical protein
MTTETTINPEEQEKEQTVFEIRAYKLPVIQEKIAKLNKRAEKLGCAPSTIVEISREVTTPTNKFVGI